MDSAILSKQELRNVRRFWQSKNVGRLVEGQTPVVLDESMDILTAFDTLVDQNILSALVKRQQRRKEDSLGRGHDVYCGIFSYRAILQVFLKHYNARNFEGQEEELGTIMAKTLYARYRDLGQFCADRAPSFVTLLTSEPLADAVMYFTNGTHRLSVVGDKGECCGVVSQSMALQFLHENAQGSPLEAILERKIEDMAPSRVNCAVLSCMGSEPFITVLRKMVDHDVSSIAILDERGELCGALSMSDLKHMLRSSSHYSFEMSLHDLLIQLRTEQAINKRAKDTFPYFGIRPHRSLKDAVSKMVALKSHRLWLIDEYHHVTGMISITDILRILAPLPI